jgi:membrane protease YdiL (CAAX protease family)
VLAELILAVLAIALLVTLRSWRKVGFRAFPNLRDVRLYWIPLFPVLPVLAAAVVGISRMRFEDFVFLLVLACLIGFVEEVFFRGLILQALVPAGPWRAAILSSIAFGLMHLLNLLFGADLAITTGTAAGRLQRRLRTRRTPGSCNRDLSAPGAAPWHAHPPH